MATRLCNSYHSHDVGQRAPGKFARDHPGLDLNGDLKLAIEGVKVRRFMVPVKHRNDNPPETVKFLAPTHHKCRASSVSIPGVGECPVAL